MKKEEKKSKRAPGLFSFCPKHCVFYASCKCALPGSSRKKAEDEEEHGDGTYVDDKK